MFANKKTHCTQQYLPFGETFVDQQNGYDSRYTFSAKEKDNETQYSYFGARYYDSDLSVWLSVDPMSDEYPHQSPYMYCSGNPVMRIDPNGMWDSDHIDEVGNVIAHYDDGDNSVYVHNNGTTKEQIDKQRADNNNTGGAGKKIGELGGNIDLSGIMRNKLTQSALKAIGMDIGSYFWAVRPGGEWDLKANESTIFGRAWAYDAENKTNTTFSFGNYSGMNAADIGNYHAGYTGRFTYYGTGMSYDLLQWGAGAAETFKSVTEGRFNDAGIQSIMLFGAGGIVGPFKPYGDRPRDFQLNTQGMIDADKDKKPIANKAGTFRR